MTHVTVSMQAQVKLVKILDRMIQERKDQIEALQMEVEALEDARRVTINDVETMERISKINAIWE